MSANNFVRSGRNFSKFFLFNTEKIVLVNAVKILSLSSSIPEIFAVKLESCRKSLHFKAIFDSPLKNVVRRAPVPGGGCATKTWLQRFFV